MLADVLVTLFRKQLFIAAPKQYLFLTVANFHVIFYDKVNSEENWKL